MTDETPTGSVSDVVARIFAEYQPEPFRLRRQPRLTEENDKEEKQPAKRPKKEALPLQLLTSDTIRHVADFLDPFEIMAWSGTCKATADACSLAFKLDIVFHQFCILKRYADRVHAKGHSWKVVHQVLLEALKELHEVYGPYQVHPMHAAMIGEALMIHLSLFDNLTEANQDNHPLLDYVWNLGDIRTTQSYRGLNFCEPLVCGMMSDYFDDDEGLSNFQEAITARPEMIPPGPGRVLAQEGRMPYINVICKELEEEGTDQFGFSFQQVEGDTSPYVVFCMNYQCLPNEYASEAAFLEWYNGPKPGTEIVYEQGTAVAYGGHTKSIEQAFCQYFIYQVGDNEDEWAPVQAPWDNWTQFLRVAWLYAHNIAPFDGRTDKGQERWTTVVQVMPPVGEAANPSVVPEWTGQEEVLSFARWDESEAGEFAKCYAPKYIKLSHNMAKGSDYC